MRAHGIIVALHTPLTPTGAVHEEALRQHLELLIRAGVHGIFPCGTMGEGIALSDADRKQVAEITLAQVRGRVPVIPQITTNNTEGCLDLARHAQKAGADAVSVIAPYFYPSDAPALEDFFTAIAKGVPDLPVYLYKLAAGRGRRGFFDFLGVAMTRTPLSALYSNSKGGRCLTIIGREGFARSAFTNWMQSMPTAFSLPMMDSAPRTARASRLVMRPLTLLSTRSSTSSEGSLKSPGAPIQRPPVIPPARRCTSPAPGCSRP